MLNVIQKRLVRKSLDMFKEIEKDEEKYKKFFTTFGKYLKVGVIEDVDNKDELASLTRWSSTESETEIYSLDEYVARMKPDQKQIYYVTGETRKIALSSPALEGLRKKGFEVLFLQDPLDEMAMQAIMKYKDYDIVDAAKEVAELDENEKKEVEAKTEEFASLTEWIQNLLGKRVTKVQISTRLTDSPAAIVQSAYGMSPQMQRYYAAQSTMDDSIMDSQFNQAILEVNPNHPVIQQLNSLVETDNASNEAKELGKMVFDLAQVTGGYGIEDPGAFGARITKMMVKNAGLSGFEEGETTRDVEDPTVKSVDVEPVKTEFNPEMVEMAENAEDLRKRGYVEDVEDESK
jgi:heat shock protein beta